MTTLTETVEAFGPVRYAIPRIGEHGSINCLFGKHWWTVIRTIGNKQAVAVACGACRKMNGIHDLGVTE